jgi:hypothetical protein
MTTVPLATTSLDLDADADADTTNVAICSSCPHPPDAHDAIAARYCAASQSTATTRGCICRSA